MVRTFVKKTADVQPKYSDEDMVKAMMAVNKGVTYGEAAKTFTVPKTSLIRRYKGTVRSPGKFGR